MVRELDSVEKFRDLSLASDVTPNSVKLGMLKLTSGILEEIRERFCVQDVLELKKSILEEGYKSVLSIQPGATKMLTKSAYFILIKISYPLQKLAERSNIHIEVLVEFTGSLGNQIVIEFFLPSADEWLDREDYPVVGGFVESLHVRARSIGMTQFEALYGKRRMTPLCWYEPDESVVLRPAIIQYTTEKITMIQEKMRASQSR
ncbi:uncharacterized protein LOC127082000 [Lathyrus oleraceus]|uniref:uncharacterized protein LOC127082000 n=1 Tax=Pisum sativum TaxID=3888 RepID=UPI0021D27668|nr:uncharacterized protein LOC127082000 [Pisum sativum]